MYEAQSKEIVQALIRAIRHYQSQADMLYENLPKTDFFDMDFTSGITEMTEEDLLAISKSAEGLANAIEDALGTESRHGEIKQIISGNQELVNSCIDSYVASIEGMKSSIGDAFAPAVPRLSQLEHELELAKKTQQSWWRKHDG